MKEKQILVLTALFLILGVTGCAAPEAAVPAGTRTPASPVEVQGKEINLDTVNGQLVITEPGEYTLSGTGQFGVKADVGSGSVVLHLNNVSISNPVSAGLIAESGDEMVVDLVEGTKNSISDGGDDDDHDGAVYGNIPLRFTGTGELAVTGNAGEGISTKNAPITFEGGNYRITSKDDGINTGGDGGTIRLAGGTLVIDAHGDGIDSNRDIVFVGADVFVTGSAEGGDAGIDSETGITILGGTVIALGSDMLEMPRDTSEQTVLALTLDGRLKEGSRAELRRADGTVIASFTAPQAYRTLVFSSPDLTEGTYSLFTDGERQTCAGQAEFAVSGILNEYGTGGMPGPGGNGQGPQPPQIPDGGNGRPPQIPDGTPPLPPDGSGNPPQMPQGSGKPQVPETPGK